MKVELENEKKEFTPKKITITLESKEEVAELYHRLNVSNKVFEKYLSNSGFDHEMSHGRILPLFSLLGTIVTEEKVKL